VPCAVASESAGSSITTTGQPRRIRAIQVWDRTGAADTLKMMVVSLSIGGMLLLLVLGGMAIHRLRRPRTHRLFDIGGVSESWLAEQKRQS